MSGYMFIFVFVGLGGKSVGGVLKKHLGWQRCNQKPAWYATEVLRNAIHEGPSYFGSLVGAKNVGGVLQNTMHRAGLQIFVVGPGPKTWEGCSFCTAVSDLGYWFADKNVGGVLQNTMPGADLQICVVGSGPKTWKGCSFCAAVTGLPRGRG